MTLLDTKIEKSLTASEIENFNPDPQLDIKFLNIRKLMTFFFSYIRRYIIYNPFTSKL